MSEMRVVPQNKIELGSYTSNVALSEPDWNSGTTYSIGDQVRVGYILYESLQDSNTGNNPETGVSTDPPTWLRLGYVNQARMFTEAKDSRTTNLDSIDVSFSGGEIYDTVAVLGMQGLTLTVEVIDGATTAWSEVVELRDYGSGDWWEYYFLPFDTREDVVLTEIPYYSGAEIRVLVETDTGDEAAVGLVMVGFSDVIGTTNWGSQVGLVNFTDFERDGFGNLRIIPRRTVNNAVFNVTVPTMQVDFVMRILRRAGGEPSLFIGDEDKEATIIWGVPEEPRINYTGPCDSSLSLEVQGK